MHNCEVEQSQGWQKPKHNLVYNYQQTLTSTSGKQGRVSTGKELEWKRKKIDPRISCKFWLNNKCCIFYSEKTTTDKGDKGVIFGAKCFIQFLAKVAPSISHRESVRWWFNCMRIGVRQTRWRTWMDGIQHRQHGSHTYVSTCTQHTSTCIAIAKPLDSLQDNKISDKKANKPKETMFQRYEQQTLGKRSSWTHNSVARRSSVKSVLMIAIWENNLLKSCWLKWRRSNPINEWQISKKALHQRKEWEFIRASEAVGRVITVKSEMMWETTRYFYTTQTNTVFNSESNQQLVQWEIKHLLLSVNFL